MSILASSRRLALSLCAVLAAGGALYGSGDLWSTPTAPEASSSSTSDVEVSRSKAGRMLEALQVKGRAPMTGYEREAFGQEWSDDVSTSGGHNGCDTRIICTPRA